MCAYIQGVSEEFAILGSKFLRLIYVEVQNIPVHEFESLRRLWRERMWFSCGSTLFTCLKFSIICALLSYVFEPIPKTSHTEENVLCEVLGNQERFL
jgi:drug/metabolite transporter (DMT)-like permease